MSIRSPQFKLSSVCTNHSNNSECVNWSYLKLPISNTMWWCSGTMGSIFTQQNTIMLTKGDKKTNYYTFVLKLIVSVYTLAQKHPWQHWDTAVWHPIIWQEGSVGRDLPHNVHTPASSPAKCNFQWQLYTVSQKTSILFVPNIAEHWPINYQNHSLLYLMQQEICSKTLVIFPPYLKHVATLPCKT